MVIGLERREQNIEEPQADQEGARDVLGGDGAAQLRLAEEGQGAAEHENNYGSYGGYGVQHDAEAQRSSFDFERRSLKEG